jgi:hypothetical protein
MVGWPGGWWIREQDNDLGPGNGKNHKEQKYKDKNVVYIGTKTNILSSFSSQECSPWNLSEQIYRAHSVVKIKVDSETWWKQVINPGGFNIVVVPLLQQWWTHYQGRGVTRKQQKFYAIKPKYFLNTSYATKYLLAQRYERGVWQAGNDWCWRKRQATSFKMIHFSFLSSSPLKSLSEITNLKTARACVNNINQISLTSDK